MSIAAIVSRGYRGGVHGIPPRGYIGGSSPPVTITDTHDPKRRRIHLPIYITKKREIEFKTAIKELPRNLPKELKKAITPELIQYDIDWKAISGYLKESGERLDVIMQSVEEARMRYEYERQEEEDFMILAMAASKI